MPEGTLIVSEPGVALALVIASRSENLPLAGVTSSRVVFTVKVEGTERSSRCSRRRRATDRPIQLRVMEASLKGEMRLASLPLERADVQDCAAVSVNTRCRGGQF